jgi:hypothetical protein
VHALHNIHAALRPGATLVDTQPISANPTVAVDGVELGELDMREWLETVKAVDELTAQTASSGLYELEHEESFVVADTFDDRSECVETVSGWSGTVIPPELTSLIRDASGTFTVAEEVRLRLYRVC